MIAATALAAVPPRLVTGRGLASYALLGLPLAMTALPINILLPDYDDVIDRSRPFLESTRQVRPPATGTSLILPILTTRAVAGTQQGNAEKAELNPFTSSGRASTASSTAS